jgi:hypothetical protein
MRNAHKAARPSGCAKQIPGDVTAVVDGDGMRPRTVRDVKHGEVSFTISQEVVAASISDNFIRIVDAGWQGSPAAPAASKMVIFPFASRRKPRVVSDSESKKYPVMFLRLLLMPTGCAFGPGPSPPASKTVMTPLGPLQIPLAPDNTGW